MKEVKKVSFVLLVTILIFSTNIFAFANGLDYSKHWAKDDISLLMEKNIISGYDNGDFKPNNPIKRAELIKIINNVFGYIEKEIIDFNDVSEKDWFYEDIQKGVKVGYIEGYSNGAMKPNSNVTREEAAKIISKAYELKAKKSKSTLGFKDEDKISSWAEEYIAALKEFGYISGYDNGKFEPKKNITRAEIVKIICSISKDILNKEGTYSKDIDGNLIVNSKDVFLKDMTISGDLYLTEGIGIGDINLENITIKGTLRIKGNGQNRVKIKDSEINSLILNSGKVELEGNVKIENLETEGIGELKAEEKVLIKKVKIKEKGFIVEVKGTIESLIVLEETKINGELLNKGMETKVDKGKLLNKDIKKEEEKKEVKEDTSREREDKDNKDVTKSKDNFLTYLAIGNEEIDIKKAETIEGVTVNIERDRVLEIIETRTRDSRARVAIKLNDKEVTNNDIKIKVGDTIKILVVAENGDIRTYTVKFEMIRDLVYIDKEGNYITIVVLPQEYKKLNALPFVIYDWEGNIAYIGELNRKDEETFSLTFDFEGNISGEYKARINVGTDKTIEQEFQY
ncbi:S-layer homology domain-containing protein [Tissierella sp. MSJ-40]|uniref:S-layer homology domain-containing protein n=1 Tax=Tissierella simiarum TaxID=2841534 RepID=A0ABS6E2B1_9FIRM|nr:S-layer homology domain-containing protein [Tissierella simiarum]MBU5436976.1 S-layer homology domain-containing protein [Tissierella simiarum]